jgi:hypothetical protein
MILREKILMPYFLKLNPFGSDQSHRINRINRININHGYQQFGFGFGFGFGFDFGKAGGSCARNAPKNEAV